MANHSKASTEELLHMATVVDKFRAETEEQLRAIHDKAWKLRENWASLSGVSFDDTMRDWNKDVKIMQDAMEDMATELRKNVDGYELLKKDTKAVFSPGGADTSAGRSYNI